MLDFFAKNDFDDVDLTRLLRYMNKYESNRSKDDEDENDVSDALKKLSDVSTVKVNTQVTPVPVTAPRDNEPRPSYLLFGLTFDNDVSDSKVKNLLTILNRMLFNINTVNNARYDEGIRIEAEAVNTTIPVYNYLLDDKLISQYFSIIYEEYIKIANRIKNLDFGDINRTKNIKANMIKFLKYNLKRKLRSLGNFCQTISDSIRNRYQQEMYNYLNVPLVLDESKKDVTYLEFSKAIKNDLMQYFMNPSSVENRGALQTKIRAYLKFILDYMGKGNNNIEYGAGIADFGKKGLGLMNQFKFYNANKAKLNYGEVGFMGEAMDVPDMNAVVQEMDRKFKGIKLPNSIDQIYKEAYKKLEDEMKANVAKLKDQPDAEKRLKLLYGTNMDDLLYQSKVKLVEGLSLFLQITRATQILDSMASGFENVERHIDENLDTLINEKTKYKMFMEDGPLSKSSIKDKDLIHLALGGGLVFPLNEKETAEMMDSIEDKSFSMFGSTRGLELYNKYLLEYDKYDTIYKKFKKDIMNTDFIKEITELRRTPYDDYMPNYNQLDANAERKMTSDRKNLKALMQTISISAAGLLQECVKEFVGNHKILLERFKEIMEAKLDKQPSKRLLLSNTRAGEQNFVKIQEIKTREDLIKYLKRMVHKYTNELSILRDRSTLGGLLFNDSFNKLKGLEDLELMGFSDFYDGIGSTNNKKFSFVDDIKQLLLIHKDYLKNLKEEKKGKNVKEEDEIRYKNRYMGFILGYFNTHVTRIGKEIKSLEEIFKNINEKEVSDALIKNLKSYLKEISKDPAKYNVSMLARRYSIIKLDSSNLSSDGGLSTSNYATAEAKKAIDSIKAILRYISENNGNKERKDNINVNEVINRLKSIVDLEIVSVYLRNTVLDEVTTVSLYDPVEQSTGYKKSEIIELLRDLKDEKTSNLEIPSIMVLDYLNKYLDMLTKSGIGTKSFGSILAFTADKVQKAIVDIKDNINKTKEAAEKFWNEGYEKEEETKEKDEDEDEENEESPADEENEEQEKIAQEKDEKEMKEIQKEKEQIMAVGKTKPMRVSMFKANNATLSELSAWYTLDDNGWFTIVFDEPANPNGLPYKITLINQGVVLNDTTTLLSPMSLDGKGKIGCKIKLPFEPVDYFGIHMRFNDPAGKEPKYITNPEFIGAQDLIVFTNKLRETVYKLQKQSQLEFSNKESEVAQLTFKDKDGKAIANTGIKAVEYDGNLILLFPESMNNILDNKIVTLMGDKDQKDIPEGQNKITVMDLGEGGRVAIFNKSITKLIRERFSIHLYTLSLETQNFFGYVELTKDVTNDSKLGTQEKQSTEKTKQDSEKEKVEKKDTDEFDEEDNKDKEDEEDKQKKRRGTTRGNKSKKTTTKKKEKEEEEEEETDKNNKVKKLGQQLEEIQGKDYSNENISASQLLFGI